jgi:hypothetical protein
MSERPLSRGIDTASPHAGPHPRDAQPSIALHIDELVLDGFDPAARDAIGAAVERELTRLLAEQGAPIGLHDQEVAALDAGSLQMESSANAEDLGARVARAVFGGLR